MKQVKILFFLSAASLLFSCREKEKYPIGHFTEEVSNLREVNSVYDDYNSDLPQIMYRHTLHFSSNRNSQGENFDVVGESFYINWIKTTGTLSIGTDMFDDPYRYVQALLDTINTPCNELGPYSIGYQENPASPDWTDITLYASDCAGNYDLSFVTGVVAFEQTGQSIFIRPSVSLDIVNTPANELYPTFFGEGFYYLDPFGPKTGNIQKMLYCSDKEGNFDLFELEVPEGIAIGSWLKSEPSDEPQRLTLSSDGDDKCPFVNGRLLVFASDRAGGFGGFDLYYSYFENGGWTEPVNFGGTINSVHDEYRPVVLHYPEFDNNLLIFSSDRPGGLGGFDLYQAGIDLDVE